MTRRLAPKPLHILLVEDNPADVRLTQEALKEGKVFCDLHWVQDGQEALDFLHKRGDHIEAARPDLILLDLNLPRIDGREVLARIKADPQLRRIPVVILSTSSAEEDIIRSYVVQVALESVLRDKSGQPLALVPGMQVNLDIVTGTRTVLTYLVKPIVRGLNQSFTER